MYITYIFIYLYTCIIIHNNIYMYTYIYNTRMCVANNLCCHRQSVAKTLSDHRPSRLCMFARRCAMIPHVCV